MTISRVVCVLYICITGILYSEWVNWREVSLVATPLSGVPGYRMEKVHRGVTYNAYTVILDGDRRACTPNKRAVRHALFWGCSATFGDGVDNKNTLSQLFQNLAPEYQSYNYGFGGAGPNNILYFLTHKNITKDVFPKKGVCFYIYPIGWHEHRIRIHSDSFHYTADHPYYELDRHKKLVYRGSLKQRQWLLYQVVKLYTYFFVFGQYQQPFPKYPTHKDFVLTAELLSEVRDAYKQQFPSNDFFVVIHPCSNFQYVEKVVQILRRRGLRVIVIDQPTMTREYMLSAFDVHPNAAANKIIARELWKKLNY